MLGSNSCPAAFGGVSSGRRPASFVSGVPANQVVGTYGQGVMGGVSMTQAHPSYFSGNFGVQESTWNQQAADTANMQQAGGGGGFWQQAGGFITGVVGLGQQVLGLFDKGGQPIQGSQPGTTIIVPGQSAPPQPQQAGIPQWVYLVGAGIAVLAVMAYMKKR